MAFTPARLEGLKNSAEKSAALQKGLHIILQARKLAP